MNSSTSDFKAQWGRFLHDVLILLVSFLIFDRLLFFIYLRTERWIYHENSGEEELRLAGQTESYQALILGSSRTHEAIHPSFLSQLLGLKAYKEAYMGRGPKYNWLFYQRYRKYFPAPRLVIYGVDYFLYELVSVRKEMTRFHRFERQRQEFGKDFSLLLANKFWIDQLLNDAWQEVDDWLKPGSTPPFRPDQQHMERYVGVEQRFGKGVSDEIGLGFRKKHFLRFPGKEGPYFRRLIRKWSKENCLVFLVAIPEYLATWKTNFQQDRFCRGMSHWCQRNRNAIFLNYNKPELFPLANRLFFLDGGYGNGNSHLSREGAAVFNQMLLNDIGRILRSRN